MSFHLSSYASCNASRPSEVEAHAEARKFCSPESRTRSSKRQARALTPEQIDRVVDHIARTSNSPASDELKFLLTVLGGLRAAEVAGLTLDDLLDAGERIAKTVRVDRHIAKGGRQRVIPMHPRVRESIVRFRAAHPGVRRIAFSFRLRNIRFQTADTVTRWFGRLYETVGLKGCSSHSDRRTFITELARVANVHRRSLHDVQLLAGHARLETTAAYIEPADDLIELVASLGVRATEPDLAQTGELA